MKLKTVNVLKHGAYINFVHSFTDDKEGNIQAEKLFTAIAKRNHLTKRKIETALNNGSFESALYSCTIIHSS